MTLILHSQPFFIIINISELILRHFVVKYKLFWNELYILLFYAIQINIFRGTILSFSRAHNKLYFDCPLYTFY